MQQIQKMVTDNMIDKFAKGMKSTEPEKSTTETILESLGQVMEGIGPILKPMADAAASSIKEKGIKPTFDPRPRQAPPPQQTPQQDAVRDAMNQQVAEQQDYEQQQNTIRQQNEAQQAQEQQLVPDQQLPTENQSTVQPPGVQQGQTIDQQPLEIETPTIPPLDYDEDYDMPKVKNPQTQQL